MNEAIKLAIEKGGYKSLFSNFKDEELNRIAQYLSLLNPLFWQALGKALRWPTPEESLGNVAWVSQWHRFIDWIAEGKDADEFFYELIKQA